MTTPAASIGQSAAVIPRYALEPIATECLLETTRIRRSSESLSARVYGLHVSDEDIPSALLVRVTDAAGNVVGRRPFSLGSWCIDEWARLDTSDARMWRVQDEHQEWAFPHLAPADSLFSLPPVRPRELMPLLEAATVHGQPGSCPALFRRDAWQTVDRLFREALPNELLVLLRGDLCQDPGTGIVFTLIDAVDVPASKTAPDAVAAGASEVAQAMCGDGGGRWIAMAHSHPVAGASGQVVISGTDLTTFRTKLRGAHMLSLICNCWAEATEPVLLSWAGGSAVTVGFYVVRD